MPMKNLFATHYPVHHICSIHHHITFYWFFFLQRQKPTTLQTLTAQSAFCVPLFVLFRLSFVRSYQPSHMDMLFWKQCCHHCWQRTVFFWGKFFSFCKNGSYGHIIHQLTCNFFTMFYSSTLWC